MNVNEPMSGGKSSAMPAVRCLDTRQAIGATAMSSGRRLLNAPVIHVSVLAGLPRSCALLERHFLDDLTESVPIVPGDWARRRWPGRMLEGLGWTMRRWL